MIMLITITIKIIRIMVTVKVLSSFENTKYQSLLIVDTCIHFKLQN